MCDFSPPLPVSWQSTNHTSGLCDQAWTPGRASGRLAWQKLEPPPHSDCEPVTARKHACGMANLVAQRKSAAQAATAESRDSIHCTACAQRESTSCIQNFYQPAAEELHRRDLEADTALADSTNLNRSQQATAASNMVQLADELAVHARQLTHQSSSKV